MKIIIPSHKRSKKITTHKHLNNCIVCVPDSQVAEYKAIGTFDVIGHPDNIIGISPKRRWIYAKFNDLFMVDDDLAFVYSQITNKNITTPIDSIINETHYITKNLGLKMYGYSRNVNPSTYSGLQLFKANGFINGGAMGLLPAENLQFPIDNVYMEDYYISLLNAYYYRACIIDLRYTFAFLESTKRVGGCSDYANRNETEKKSYFFMKKHFGDSVRLKYDGNPKVRMRKNPYEITIRTSFNK